MDQLSCKRCRYYDDQQQALRALKAGVVVTYTLPCHICTRFQKIDLFKEKK